MRTPAMPISYWLDFIGVTHAIYIYICEKKVTDVDTDGMFMTHGPHSILVFRGNLPRPLPTALVVLMQRRVVTTVVTPRAQCFK